MASIPETTALSHAKSFRRRPLSWTRRLLFSLICLCLLAGLLELACFIGLKCLTFDSLSVIRRDRKLDAESANLETDQPLEVGHPYLGWTRNPPAHHRFRFEGREYLPNDFGLMDEASPIRKRSPEKIIVAVTGGSVAWQMSATGGDAFLQELRRQPRFQGKKLELVRLALDGYKQPQQLILLTFLLSLGAEFDILVNIDGLNETALHPAENALSGTFPPYPRAWKLRQTESVPLQDMQLKARYIASIARRRDRSQWYSGLPFQNTATVNFFWLSIHQRLLHEEMVWNVELLNRRLAAPNYQLVGPSQSFRDDDEMFDYLVAYWAQCSRQMERVCRANSIEYHHVLPPNQHLAGSKPQMNPEEQATALRVSAINQAAQKAYPLLVQKGRELAAEGLRFHDLTALFATVAEPIYVDNCCHYNPTGSQRLAAAVAKSVANSTR